MSAPVQAIDLTKVTLHNGEWYAFDLGGRKFFATVYNNPFTGHLELTEIPDPYICAECGEGYQEGAHHGIRKPEMHEYRMRGPSRRDGARA
jgi:hypothetical protein